MRRRKCSFNVVLIVGRGRFPGVRFVRMRVEEGERRRIGLGFGFEIELEEKIISREGYGRLMMIY